MLTIAAAPAPLAPAVFAASESAGSGSSWLFLILLFVGGSALVMAWASWVRTMHLALGFATTALIWALGYLSIMQPGQALGEILFGLMLVVLFGGGFVAGRFGRGAGGEATRPAAVGLVSAFANLLVLGAFLRDEQHGSKLTPVLYVVGLFVVSGGLAWLGGIAGRRSLDEQVGRPVGSTSERSALPAPTSLFSVVAAVTVFLLLITGGLVTSMESGLAVPDWPNSFGHNMLLYPVSEMKGGIFYEHAHRLYGMLVGTTSLVLVVVVWRSERQGWLRALAIVTLLAVCFQGYLGGTRVTGDLTLSQDRSVLAPSIVRAIIHGVFAQLVFAAFLLIAATTSRTWREAIAVSDEPSALVDRSFAFLLPSAFLLQLILGALYRHLQPPGGVTAAGHPMWAILAHITMAIVVASLVAVAAGRAWGHAHHPVLRRLGMALIIGVGVQLCLGVVAVAAVWTRAVPAIPAWEAITVTLHQVTGAGLLGLAVLLAAWSRRLIPVTESHRLLVSAA